MTMSSTLSNLKETISHTPSICEEFPIQPKYQRLFHLGRELKSSKRSLKALGFGRHGTYLVHLHSTQPKTLELSSDEEVAVELDSSKSSKRKGIQYEAVVDESPGESNMPPRAGENIVVDLVGSDDDLKWWETEPIAKLYLCSNKIT